MGFSGEILFCRYIQEERARILHKRRATLEMRECQEHQYYLGEEHGRLVDIEDAIMDYSDTPRVLSGDGRMISHAERFANTYVANKLRILQTCDETCGPGNCEGPITYCPLSNQQVHVLLKD